MQVEWVRYGPEAAAALVGAVDAAKGGDPLSPVTVVVPSNYVGVTARRLLGRRPPGIAAVTFLTVYRLAELLGAPLLAAQGRRPVSNPVLAAGVRTALRADPGMFAPVAEHPATETALVAAYSELRELTDDGLDALAAASSRARDVVRLHRAVRSHLARGWYDEQDLLVAAATVARDDRIAVERLGRVVVHLPQRLTRTAAELLRAIDGTGSVVVLAGTCGDARADSEVIRGIGRLGAVEPPPVVDSSAVADAARTRVLSASDADDEVRAAVRAVVREVTDGTPLERIAILHASPEPYAGLVHERLAAAGIPSNGAAVVPLAARALGRTLLRLLALADHGYRRDDVLGLLSAPVLHKGRPAPAHAWERISRDAAVVAGRDHWDRLLAAFAAERDAEAAAWRDDGDPGNGADGTAGGADGQGWRAGRAQRQAAHARSLREFALDLIDELDGTAADPRPWSQHARWAGRLGERLLGGDHRRATWPPVEAEAADKVLVALDRLAGLDGVEGPVGLDIFRRTLELELDRDLGRVGRFGEGVLVGGIGMGVGLDLDLVIVLGLAEGTFPAAVHDDGLLPDDERAAGGDDLVLRGDRVEREHRELLAALASARRQLLCLPRGDLRRNAERVASRWLLDLTGALAGEQLWSPDLLALDAPWIEHVPSFAAGVSRLELPADEHEHRLRSLVDETDRAPLGVSATVGTDPVLSRGAELLTARRSNRFTRYDGNLGGVAVPTPLEGRTSATRLQVWAACPHRYFLQYMLRVEPVERPEEALELAPVDRGSLIHRVLDRFIAEVVARPIEQRPAPDDRWSDADRLRLRTIALEECDAAEARGITGRDIFWRRDRPRLVAELERFLDADDDFRREARTRPVATELPFDDVTLVVDGGDALHFHGAADRIDIDEHGSLHVIDYKTGKPAEYEGLSADDPDLGGTMLQLPVYGAAARQHQQQPGAQVIAEYWFVSDKGEFKRIGYEVSADVLARVGRTLRVIVDGIAGGLFPAHPTDKTTQPFVDCWFCDPDGMGVADRRGDWERKRDDPALAAYVQLVEPRDETAVGADHG
jgi:RecB family exonuclease